MKSFEKILKSKVRHVMTMTDYKNILEAQKEYESQFKQPPVSVMPSEEIVRTLRTIEQMSDPGDPYKAVYEMKSIASDLIDKILSLSKEAPKEQDGPCNTCGKWFHPCLCEKIKGMDQPQTSERETAILFAEWISKNGWELSLRNNGTWVNIDQYKTTDDLFDLFKQKNK